MSAIGAIGTAAIVGISVGGSVLFLIFITISVILLVRWRRRRILAQGHRRWKSHHEDGSGVQINDALDNHRTYRGVSRTPNVSPQRSLRRTNNEGAGMQVNRPWLRGVDLGLQRARAGCKENGFRLSWPLNSKKPSKVPVVLGGSRLTRLSPITESPIPRSVSTPELSPGLQLTSVSGHDGRPSSKMHQALDHGLNYSSAQNHGTDTTPLTADLPYQMTHPRPNSQRDHLRGLRRWKSDSYRLQRGLSFGSPARVPKEAMTPTSQYIRLRSTSLYDRAPGMRPEQPLPSLPPNAWATCLRASAAPEPISSNNYPATPTSFVSASTSILDCNVSPLKVKRGSWASDARAATSSPVSSRTSQGLSIYEEPVQWDIPPSTGLSSPSKKRLPQDGQFTDVSDAMLRSSMERRKVQIVSGGQMIRDGSRVSLATLGRRDSLGPRNETLKGSQNRQLIPIPNISLVNAPHTGSLAVPNQSRMSVTLEKDPTAAGAQLRWPGHRVPSQTQPIKPLQDVSGNNVDPFRTRLYSQGSIIESQSLNRLGEPCKRFTPPAKPVSALKQSGVRRNGHKRQNCVRISNLPPIILGPGSCSPIYEDHKQGSPSYQIKNHARMSINAAGRLPQPVFRSTFDPQVSPTPRRTSSYDSDMKEDMRTIPRPLSCVSQPRNQDPTKRQHKQFKLPTGIGSPGPSIPSSPPSSLPRLTSTSTPHFTFTASGLSPPRSLKAVKEPSPPRQPSFEFPKPASAPAPAPAPSTPSSSSSVRKHRSSGLVGPRAPPAKISRTTRSADIHGSVLALRRMNSEVTRAGDGDGPSQRYLNMGSSSPERRVQSPVENGSGLRGRDASADSAAAAALPKTPEKKVLVGFRDSRDMQMPYPRVAGKAGLGLSWNEDPYDQNGFLRD